MPLTGSYSVDKRVASFVGFIPAESPELVILALLDEPKGQVYGGLDCRADLQSCRGASPATTSACRRPIRKISNKILPSAETIAKCSETKGGGSRWSGAVTADVVEVDENGEAIVPGRQRSGDAELPRLEQPPGPADMAQDSGLNVKLIGSGRVMEQDPAAGMPIPYGERKSGFGSNRRATENPDQKRARNETIQTAAADCRFTDQSGPRPEITATRATTRARPVPGAAFFALRGQRRTGTDSSRRQWQQGRKSSSWRRSSPCRQTCCGIVVADCREALALAAAEFFRHPGSGTLHGRRDRHQRQDHHHLSARSDSGAAGQAPAVLGTVSYRFGEVQLSRVAHHPRCRLSCSQHSRNSATLGATAAGHGGLLACPRPIPGRRASASRWRSLPISPRNISTTMATWRSTLPASCACSPNCCRVRGAGGDQYRRCLWRSVWRSDSPSAVTCGRAAQASDPSRADCELSVAGIHGGFRHAGRTGAPRHPAAGRTLQSSKTCSCAVAAGVALGCRRRPSSRDWRGAAGAGTSGAGR